MLLRESDVGTKRQFIEENKTSGKMQNFVIKWIRTLEHLCVGQDAHPLRHGGTPTSLLQPPQQCWLLYAAYRGVRNCLHSAAQRRAMQISKAELKSTPGGASGEVHLVSDRHGDSKTFPSQSCSTLYEKLFSIRL